MKKVPYLMMVVGWVVVLGLPLESEASCLVFCDDSDEVAVVEVEDSKVRDSSVSAGDGNTTAVKNSNSVIIGGDVFTTQSNSIGGIGVNRGDINQTNSANITGQQNTNMSGNDMRSFRGTNGNNNN